MANFLNQSQAQRQVEFLLRKALSGKVEFKTIKIEAWLVDNVGNWTWHTDQPIGNLLDEVSINEFLGQMAGPVTREFTFEVSL